MNSFHLTARILSCVSAAAGAFHFICTGIFFSGSAGYCYRLLLLFRRAAARLALCLVSFPHTAGSARNMRIFRAGLHVVSAVMVTLIIGIYHRRIIILFFITSVFCPVHWTMSSDHLFRIAFSLQKIRVFFGCFHIETTVMVTLIIGIHSYCILIAFSKDFFLCAVYRTVSAYHIIFCSFCGIHIIFVQPGSSAVFFCRRTLCIFTVSRRCARRCIIILFIIAAVLCPVDRSVSGNNTIFPAVFHITSFGSKFCRELVCRYAFFCSASPGFCTI